MKRYRLGFAMEQTLGHVTHARNLRQWVCEDDSVAAEWMPVEYRREDRYERMPLVRGNWTLKASLRARAEVKAVLRKGPLDGLFFHTQVTALFSAGLMRSLPTVVSLDATPINVDSVGAAYDHAPSRSGVVEAWKNALNCRTFRSARQLVTWCEWAKRSLVADYGVAADKVTVIPPGIDLERWRFDRSKRRLRDRTRLLFVGGDFRRKGGPLLLKTFRESLAGACELDIVTREDVDVTGLSNVRVHHGLTSNAPDLLALYESADIFVFPTLGDCLPIAVMEAMAAELPVIATDVGAVSEEVIDGETGFLISPGDAESLTERTLRLATDSGLRRGMGAAGRRRAEELFDGARNYRAVVALYKGCVDGS